MYLKKNSSLVKLLEFCTFLTFDVMYFQSYHLIDNIIEF